MNPIVIFETYIKGHSIFSDQEISAISSLAVTKSLKKRENLLCVGEVCKFYTFVCTGCLRSYRLDRRGGEHIVSFSPVNHWVGSYVSLMTNVPSNEFVDALEDSTVIQLSSEAFNSLLLDVPKFAVLITKVLTDDYGRNRDRIYMMLSNQAQERYSHFIRHFPQLNQRVPIYMIASYLGVSRETLTRIRNSM